MRGPRFMTRYAFKPAWVDIAGNFARIFPLYWPVSVRRFEGFSMIDRDPNMQIPSEPMAESGRKPWTTPRVIVAETKPSTGKPYSTGETFGDAAGPS